GGGNNSFTLAGGTLSGAIVGGAGVNSLTGDNVPNTWTISGANAGGVTGVTGGFTQIANLKGGTTTDSFTLSATGNISGTISGGGVATGNTLTGNSGVGTWTVNAPNGGTLVDANGTNTFADVGNLTGGGGNNSFTLAGGTLSGAIVGGAGVNSLTGDNVPNTWTISGANAGGVTGVTGGFTQIANLNGGTSTDSFTLSATGHISGTISGGGVATGNTLTGNSGVGTWTVNAPNGGTLVDANGTNTFADVGNLTGGGGNNSFTLAGGTLSGAIVGGAGVNSLTGDNVPNTWTISGANAGGVTGVTGGFTQIANLNGGTSTDSFTLSATGHISGTISGGG